MSINLEYGGIDLVPAAPLLRRFGSVDLSRLHQLPAAVAFTGYPPDLIFLQEGQLYDINGAELLHFTERLLRRAGLGTYRGLLTRSEHNDLHRVVYVNTARIEVAHHWCGVDPNEGTRRYGWSELVVDGDDERSMMVKSIHLDPRDGDHRLAQVRFLAGAVKEGQRAMIAGDFNTATARRSRRRGEPQRRFRAQTPRDRFGKGHWPPRPRWWWGPGRRRQGDTTADTRAADYLIDIGWGCQHIADHNTTPTIHPGVDRGGELIIDRAFTHGALRTVPGTVRVDTQHRISDHRTISGAVTIEPGTDATLVQPLLSSPGLQRITAQPNPGGDAQHG